MIGVKIIEKKNIFMFTGGFYPVPGSEFELKKAGESFIMRRKFFEDESDNFTDNSYTFIGKLYHDLDCDSGKTYILHQ